jgi:ribosomal protein L19E
MKRSGIVGAIVIIALLSGCSRVKPAAGEEAVLTKQPMFFGHGGVDPTPVTVGSTYVAWTTSAFMVDMKPLQFEVSFNDLMSKDGIPLHFDSVMRLKITNSVDLIKRFGPDWYNTNVKSEFSNRVRQAVRKHGMNEVAIDTTAIDAIDAEVTQQMISYIKSSGMPLALIKITVGKASPPPAIRDQRIRTASEQQRQITEDNTRNAEDHRKAAEQARANADNAYRLQMNLTPEQFVELERIKMMRETCDNGKCTFIVGNATPVISNR